VEFAIVAPVFFLLVLGMIEFGRLVMTQQLITNASREGARQAILDGGTCESVTAEVDDFLTGSGIAGAEVGFEVNDVTTSDLDSIGYGDPVTVTVTVPFSEVSWLPSPIFIGGDTELSAETTMRRETVQ